MSIKTYIFWQNILSIHQAAFIRVLAIRDKTRVYCAYEEDLSEARTSMGWTIPDYGAAVTCDVRNISFFNELCAMDYPEVCHVFGSYFVLPHAYKAFKKLRTSSCLRVWTSEAFDFYGWQGWLRLMRCRWHVLREAENAFDYVFGMGQLGVDFFRRAGIPNNKVFEFAYITDPVSVALPSTSVLPDNGEVLFLFAGQLLNRKGVDLLFQAISALGDQDWRLLILGEGPQRDKLEYLARKLKINHRVEFLGNQSNLITQAWMRRADSLVLPSRWDGWGAVVNESLLAGCPAIVSDACGSASLLRNEQRGHVFAREQVSELSSLLEAQLKRGKQSPESRAALAKWAHEALDSLRLVDYFCYIVDRNSASSQRQVPWK
jgi:glycosyltransferase involved in cell wall biosynthesis